MKIFKKLRKNPRSMTLNFNKLRKNPKSMTLNLDLEEVFEAVDEIINSTDFSEPFWKQKVKRHLEIIKKKIKYREFMNQIRYRLKPNVEGCRTGNPYPLEIRDMNIDRPYPITFFILKVLLALLAEYATYLAFKFLLISIFRLAKWLSRSLFSWLFKFLKFLKNLWLKMNNRQRFLLVLMMAALGIVVVYWSIYYFYEPDFSLVVVNSRNETGQIHYQYEGSNFNSSKIQMMGWQDNINQDNINIVSPPQLAAPQLADLQYLDFTNLDVKQDVLVPDASSKIEIKIYKFLGNKIKVSQ